MTNTITRTTTRRRLASTSVATAALLSTLVACSSSKHNAASSSSSAAATPTAAGSTSASAAPTRGKLGSGRGDRRHVHDLGPVPAVHGGLAMGEAARHVRRAAGVTIKRTGYDTTDLTNKALLAGAAGQLRPTCSSSTTRWSRPSPRRACSPPPTRTKLDTARDRSRTCSAPGQLDGKTYGVPIGANTLALYYNKNGADGRRRRHRLGQGLGVADRGAGQGQGGRQEGHHLLGDRHRGGQLPVPAVVLGLRREPDQARLAAGRRGAARCGPTG